MPFDDVINEHLELKRRNARLAGGQPLERYLPEVTGDNPSPFDRDGDAVGGETQAFLPAWLTPGEWEEEANCSSDWDVLPLFERRD